MNETCFDDLIAKIYDAALLPELWPVFLEQLAESFGSCGAVLYLVDLSNRRSISHFEDISFIRSVHIEPKALQDCDVYYSKVNVWLDKTQDLPVGEAVITDALCNASDLAKTEWYNDWLKPQGFYRSLISHIAKQDNMTVRMSIFRDRQHEFAAAELAFFARLLPHLHRACLIFKKIAEIKSLQDANVNVLNHMSCGIVLFDKFAQAVFCNQVAAKMASSCAGLSFVFGAAASGLSVNTKQVRALRNLVKQSIDSGQSQMTSWELGSCSSPLSVVVIPLKNQPIPFIGAGPSAVLFICDPSSPIHVDDALMAHRYRLTTAETRLLKALLAGHSLSEYEAKRGVSHNTAKTQLKQVMAKTGTHRQAELLQLVAKSLMHIGPESDGGY